MTYVRYALFDSLQKARETVKDIESAAKWEEPVVLVLHEEKLSDDRALSLMESDGRRGLVLGVLSGTLAGGLLGLLMVAVGLLPLSLLSGALFGLFFGLLIGGLGGGLYGSGLAARALQQVEKLHQRGMVLLTIEVPGTLAMLKVMNIVRRHQAIATR